jgi:exodeoxyribonuclease VII small subunit
VAKKKFEDLVAELEQIVDRLEGGELGLDDAMAEFEKGTKLLKACQEILAKAEKQIETLTGVDEGTAQTELFDAEAGGTGE